MKTRCRKCNKMFHSKGILGQNKCPECVAAANPYGLGGSKAQMVRDIVKENPGISAGAVSALTGLPTAQIIEYLKIEIIELTEGSQAYLRCDDCGAKIRTGIYCPKCKENRKTVVKMSAAERYRTGKMHDHARYARKSR